MIESQQGVMNNTEGCAPTEQNMITLLNYVAATTGLRRKAEGCTCSATGPMRRRDEAGWVLLLSSAALLCW